MAVDRLFISLVRSPESADSKVEELDLATLLGLGVQNPPTAVGPFARPRGMGGINDVDLHYTDEDGNDDYTLDPDNNLADLTGPVALGSNTIADCGGLDGRLYTTYTNSPANIEERNPSTLAVINNAAAPGDVGIGCGATATQLYFISLTEVKIYKIDKDTLAVQGVGVAVAANPRGCGGTATRLFMTAADKIIELDPDTMLSINGAGITTTSSYLGRGIGGLKGDIVPPPVPAFVPVGETSVSPDKALLPNDGATYNWLSADTETPIIDCRGFRELGTVLPILGTIASLKLFVSNKRDGTFAELDGFEVTSFLAGKSHIANVKSWNFAKFVADTAETATWVQEISKG